MPISNYTTRVPASQSIASIQDMLIKHGAVGFMMDYEKDTGRIKSLHFVLENNGEKMHFKLPVAWEKFQAVLRDQEVARSQDEDYCYRVAWRNIYDWVKVQMAFYETQMVTLPQIFLPYAVVKDNKTLWEQVSENPQLFLAEK